MAEKEKAQMASRMLREWGREQIEGRDEIDLTVLAHQAMLQFEADEEFMALYRTQEFQPWFREGLRRLLMSSRRLRLLGNTAVTDDQLARDADAKPSRWHSWLEHAGGGVHVRLLKMDREQCLSASAERRVRSTEELARATLLARLADGLEGGQVVEDRYTVEEIEGLYQAIKKSMKRRRGAA